MVANVVEQSPSAGTTTTTTAANTAGPFQSMRKYQHFVPHTSSTDLKNENRLPSLI